LRSESEACARGSADRRKRGRETARKEAKEAKAGRAGRG